MKKHVLSTFLFSLFSLASVQGVSAYSISGTIRDNNNNRVSGASVSATCGSQTDSDTTSGGGNSGQYTLFYNNSGCKKDVTVVITASKSGSTGSISKKLNGNSSTNGADIRLSTPSPTPTNTPTAVPTSLPSATPTIVPTNAPTGAPTATIVPTATPTETPSVPEFGIATGIITMLSSTGAYLALKRKVSK
jgi:hypothetical protein